MEFEQWFNSQLNARPIDPIRLAAPVPVAALPTPALLLDEPTASLDPTNRATVLAMITEAKLRGAAIVGIFHDHAARDEICDRQLDVTHFTPGLAA